MHVILVAVLLIGLWPGDRALARSTSADPVAVRADFNDDGAEDLVVGVPSESVGNVEFAGAVNVIYGSANGLAGTGSQLFTQDSPGIGSTVESGDVFGAALATGDFDDDGYSDLAVGVPGEAVGNVQGAGAVNVIYGSANGLSGAGSQLFTQDTAGIGSTVEAFDNFGAALAAADLDRDGPVDLAIGAPFERVGTVFDAGAVNVVYGSTAGLAGAGSQLFTQDVAGVGSTVEPTDRFGSALTAGDFDGDTLSDLAVGAPLETVGSGPTDAAGAVNVLFGTPAGLQGAGSQLFTQDHAGIADTAEAFDNFGATLASGDFNDDGTTDLVIAVPNEGSGAVGAAGAVHVLPGSSGGLQALGSQLFTQNSAGVGSSSEQDDVFGTGLGTGDFDGDGFVDLAVGAPGETVGAVYSAGAVNVLYGSTAGLAGAGSQLFTQDVTGVGSTVEAFDAFGWELVAGDVDGDGDADLDIGVLGEDVGVLTDAGAINVLPGSPTTGLSGAGSQLFTQDTAGIISTAEPGDNFGGVLAVARAS
jgi:hypothetical protein